MSKDYFQKKANEYEQDSNRVNNVDNIAKAILNQITFNKNQHIMDFGSGTGLLLEKIAPYVDKITAVDVSKSMNENLEKKRNLLPCKLDIVELDLTTANLDIEFDGIISSMTIHHIKDLQKIFDTFYRMLKNDGALAIADLDLEDGSFHTEDTGVFHFGFDRDKIIDIAKSAGFKNLNIVTASVAKKPYADFPIFLLTGNK